MFLPFVGQLLTETKEQKHQGQLVVDCEVRCNLNSRVEFIVSHALVQVSNICLAQALRVTSVT